ncbi:alpha/beta hydrolase [Sporolactobacillus sp. STCC-11]|uniref:alpha/beta hydrolase n=1 Tax=Sporolactobacillus caesalpiniae TaxID=3230362 RepID=UPI0033936D56
MRSYPLELLTELKKTRVSHENGIAVKIKPIPDDHRSGVLDPRVLVRIKQKKQYKDSEVKNEIDRDSIHLNSMRSQMGAKSCDLTTQEITITEKLIPVGLHYINTRIYSNSNQTNETKKVAIYFHGGGFFGGSAAMLDHQCQLIAEKSNALVLSPDYRLAPETPFPCGLEDCLGIINWVSSNYKDLHSVPNHIVLIGDSAGGNLAVVCALNDQKQRIKSVISLYGAFDINPPETSYGGWDYSAYTMDNKQRSFIHSRLNRFRILADAVRALYIPGNISVNHPDICPLYADNLDQLPPVTLIEAEFDYFRLSNDQLAKKITEAGKQIDVIRYLGMDHGFFDRLGENPQTEDCIEEIAQIIKNA